MDKKRKLTLIVLGIVIIALCTVATYAYFTATITGNTSNKNIKVDMSKMKLEFSDKTGKVKAENINPGWTYQKKVTVTNTGTVPVKYDLVWLSLQNEIKQNEMVYSITCDNCNGIDENPVPSYGGENLKILTNTIDASQTQEYTINFKFKEINAPQDYNQNKKFTGNIGIKENNTYEEIPVGILSDTDWEYTLDEENNKVMLTRYKSENKNVEIYPTYLKDNKEYKTVIKKFNQPTSGFRGMFYGYNYSTVNYDAKIEKVKFMGNVEFEDNSIGYLFYRCSSLKEINITKLDFSKISSVNQWLSNCDAITNQDQIKGFNNLSKLTNMNGLFNGLKNIQNLNLISWNTSKVTNMYYMFSGCTSLMSLDLSNFDTSKVENMSGMFISCSSLTNLDLSNFDTSKVIDMAYMFSGCNSLSSLDLSTFDTTNVTNMSYMFGDCSSLTNLDLSNFDTSKVEKFYAGPIFYGMTSLKELHIDNFSFASVTGSGGDYIFGGSTPTDVHIYTNETAKDHILSKHPTYTNITVV